MDKENIVRNLSTQCCDVYTLGNCFSYEFVGTTITIAIQKPGERVPRWAIAVPFDKENQTQAKVSKELFDIFLEMVEDPREEWLVDTDDLNYKMVIGITCNFKNAYEEIMRFFVFWPKATSAARIREESGMEKKDYENYWAIICVELNDYLS